MATPLQEHVGPKPVEIRDFEPKDYEAVVEIACLLYPEHRWTVDEARYDDETFDRTKYFFRRWVAEEPGAGRVIAAAEMQHMPTTFHPQKFWVWVGVHPEWQRRGVGAAMYSCVLEQLRENEAIAIRASARETDAGSIGWLERRGFVEKLRDWESHLDVASVDLGRFGDRARLPEGIRVVTLQEELARGEDCLRGVFELKNTIGPDIPRPDPYTTPTYDTFLSDIRSPYTMPDGYFLAKDGDRYVGISNLWRSQGLPDVLYHGLTGVLREYRGRGIAWALKIRTIAYARDQGVRELRTWNDTMNGPILAINEKLGFVKQPAWITFERDLTSGGPA